MKIIIEYDVYVCHCCGKKHRIHRHHSHPQELKCIDCDAKLDHIKREEGEFDVK